MHFYYKGLPSKSSPQSRSKSTKQNGKDANTSNLLDLTGSPLKDSCQFELLGESMADELLPKDNAWKNEEEQYQPLTLEKSQ